MTPTPMNKNEQIRAAILNIRNEGSRRVIAMNEEQERHRQAQRERRGERDGRFLMVLLRHTPVLIFLGLVAAWCFYAGNLLMKVPPSTYYGSIITGLVFLVAAIAAVCAGVLRVFWEYLELNPTVLPEREPDVT